jgi:hypothetical protein
MEPDKSKKNIERAIDNVFAALDAAQRHLIEAAHYWEELQDGDRA